MKHAEWVAYTVSPTTMPVVPANIVFILMVFRGAMPARTAQSSSIEVVSNVRGRRVLKGHSVGAQGFCCGRSGVPVVHVGLEAAVEEEGEGEGDDEQDEGEPLQMSWRQREDGCY
jgi:hypothetical protein